MHHAINFETFGGFIRNLRINLNKSMGQLSRELGISLVYYSEVESGKKPSFPLKKVDYAKLAEALQVRKEILLQVAETDREKRSMEKAFDCSNEYTELAVAFGRRLSNKQLTERQMQKIRDILNEVE